MGDQFWLRVLYGATLTEDVTSDIPFLALNDTVQARGSTRTVDGVRIQPIWIISDVAWHTSGWAKIKRKESPRDLQPSNPSHIRYAGKTARRRGADGVVGRKAMARTRLEEGNPCGAGDEGDRSGAAHRPRQPPQEGGGAAPSSASIKAGKISAGDAGDQRSLSRCRFFQSLLLVLANPAAVAFTEDARCPWPGGRQRGTRLVLTLPDPAATAVTNSARKK
uniref:Uncharacterized protein n=1 Tax=Oryza glumipatula TaxID=40148 RepID=A0A0D9YGL8_9ORYZ